MMMGAGDRGPEEVLIIDDDFNFSQGLALFMQARGLPCRVVRDAAGCRAALDDAQRPIGAAILDIGLHPYWNAQEALAMLQRYRVPVVVLSAVISDAEEAALLCAGVSDVVRKATDLYVLMVRLRRVLAHREGGMLLPVLEEAATASGEPLLLDPQMRRVIYARRMAALTERETLILERLFAAAGAPVSKEALIGTLPEPRRHLDRRAIEVTISRIRGKMRNALGAQAARRLVTCRLRGYRISGPAASRPEAAWSVTDDGRRDV